MSNRGGDCSNWLHACLRSTQLYLSYFQLIPVSLTAVFLTGSDRIPIHGMESMRIIIQSTTAEEHYLPVAHTCYNLLDMPRYQTKDILRRRLTQAVEQYEGFSLV